ncbi:MFS transporter [Aureliella helgolandensis]|uniref:Putative sulfoacetate transporter SauU n=1 Tax=Aureliella helgolandensis TaxID=2527968 RepID=A0A518GA89_9BACT|nr:MFS transporter [Aureliella helgolandensis]QDV25516.1 putative sulfoacetate transporter SauU [Aureliella helgolandensis]
MRIPFRSLLVGATFLLSILLYVDRVCISAAKGSLATDLSLSDQQMGWVFAAFSLGYALFQTPSGWLADRLGPRRVLAAIVVVWSVFTGLTAMATSLVTLLIVRFLFGAGEAGAFPGIARAMYSWIPMQERGMVQGINFSGSRIGAALTLPLISLLIADLGWRPTFVILMCIGIVWALLWFLFFRDDPTDAKNLSPIELQYILANRQEGQEKSANTDSSMASASRDSSSAVIHPAATSLANSMRRSTTVWALCGQYFASNFIFFFGLTWFFPELKLRFGLSGFEASLFAAVPLLCGALGNWTSGWLVDRLYSANRWRLSRRLPAMIGFALAGLGIMGCAYATTPLASSFWFSLCIFGADMTLSPSWSTCVDIGKSNAGVVSGMMNMAGNIGAFLTSLAFPYLMGWTGSPLPFFYVAAVLNVAAIGLWLLIEPTVALNANRQEAHA